jgi:hypothetical protein
MPAQERWSRENAGSRRDLCCGRGEGEGHGFSYLLESHMTYLAGSHVLRSWPGIRLNRQPWLPYTSHVIGGGERIRTVNEDTSSVPAGIYTAQLSIHAKQGSLQSTYI